MNQLPFDDLDESLFKNVKSKLFLRPRTGLTQNDKNLIIECVKFMIKNNINSGKNKDILKYITENCNDYDTLKQKLNAETDEKVLAYLLKAFQCGTAYSIKPHNYNGLMYQLARIYARTTPLNNQEEWLSNFTISSPLYALSFIVWQPLDNNIDYSKIGSPQPVNYSEKIDFKKWKEYIVTDLKELIIKMNFFNNFTIKPIIKAIREKQPVTQEIYAQCVGKEEHLTHSTLLTLTDEEVCDIAYYIYPFFSGGCHGCDFYDATSISLNLDEYHDAFKRYPSMTVGLVLNLDKYSQGGSHWVCLQLTEYKVKLLCSAGSSFTAFHDNGELANKLQNLRWSTIYNTQIIQHDNSQCGVFSVLSNIALLIYPSLSDAVNFIGQNAESIQQGADISDFREKMFGVKN